MIFRDNRTMDFHQRIMAVQQANFEAVIVSSSFDQMQVIISWLTEEAARMTQESVNPPTALEEVAIPRTVHTALEQGDELLSHAFDSHKLLPSDTDAASLRPLTLAVSRICAVIWNVQSPEGAILMVDNVLQAHVESLLAESLAKDPRICQITHWQTLTQRFSTSLAFYHSLIDNIPLPIIEEFERQLQFLPDLNNVLHKLDYFDKYSTPEAYHHAYLEKQKALESASPWKYVHELTREASYAHFEESEIRQSIVFRLPVARWVRWIDRLFWPFTQAVAFHIFSDLSKMEEFLQDLVRSAPELSTPYPQILMIALDRYYYIVHEISRNLYQVCRVNSHYDKEVLEEVQKKAKLEWGDWKATGLRSSLTLVMDTIFSNPALISDSFLQGLFDWVTGQDRAHWVNLPLREPMLLDFDTLYEVLLAKVRSEPGLKARLLTSVQSEEMTWPKANLLFELYIQDESDSTLRALIVQKHVEWLQSKSFYWNHQLTYNDEVINQAYRFAYLIERGPNPEHAIRSFTKQYWQWHEGWPAKLNKSDNPSKELFLLMTGSTLCFRYLQNGDRARALPLFEGYLRMLLDQYRVASETSRERYCLVFRFLVYLYLKFDLPDFPEKMTGLLSQIDHIEEIIQISHDWIETCGFLEISLHPDVRKAVQERIDNEYWILEAKIKAGPPMHPIRHYAPLHAAIIAAFAAA